MGVTKRKIDDCWEKMLMKSLLIKNLLAQKATKEKNQHLINKTLER